LIISDAEVGGLFSTLTSSRPKHIGSSLQNLAPKRARRPQNLDHVSTDDESSDEEFVPVPKSRRAQPMILKMTLHNINRDPIPPPTIELPRLNVPMESSCDFSISVLTRGPQNESGFGPKRTKSVRF